MLKYLKIALILALFAGGYETGRQQADHKWKEKISNEYITKVEAGRSTQRQVSIVSADYQAKLAKSKEDARGTVDALRSDNKRLRVKVKASSGPTGSNSGCVTDGKAELDDSTAESLIRITQDGDKQIEALQETIKKLQGGK